MKMFKALGSGALRSVKAYKGVIIIWFIYLVLISLIVIPVKGALKAGFGNSMIVELLKDGINIEVFSDLDLQLKDIIASFTIGIILVCIVTVIMNAFLSGGLFTLVKGGNNDFSISGFLRSSAKNFWSFLGVTLLICLIILVLGLLIIGIPFALSFGGGSGPGPSAFIIMVIAVLLFIITLVILLLVVDYSRAWIVRNEARSCFKAFAFGFRKAFGTFLSSFPLMLLLMIIFVLFTLVSRMIVDLWNPLTGIGALALFIISQVLFFCILLLKTWRYGSVTALMEYHFVNLDEESDK
jgi:hypothetical protein